MKQVAIITGITGQDGSYLAEDLLEQGVHVFGGIRHSSYTPHHLGRISHLIKEYPDQLTLIHLDLLDLASIEKFVKEVYDKTHMILKLGNYIQVYNLAAQSHVGDSFRIPTVTHQINALSVIAFLDSLRTHFSTNFRFYQASTSELYGNIQTTEEKILMMNEETPFNPESPYAVAKMAAVQTVQNYRKAYGIHAVNGILFNHESPNRGSDFVTRKITKYVAQYSRNAVEDNKPLQLGNLNAKRDWGDAREYIKAMQLMLNIAEGEKITDYVVATGDVYSVRTFVAQAFQKIGVYMEWVGEGAIEKGINKINGRDILVEVNSEFYRPIDVGYLCGDSSLICKNLRWKPTVQLKQLISDMVEHDIQLLKG